MTWGFMRRRLSSRTIAVVAGLLFMANPSAVSAAYTSILVGTTATMTGDGAADTLRFGVAELIDGTLIFTHNHAGEPGFNSQYDFDTTVAGDQTVAPTGIINIHAGDGNDLISSGRRRRAGHDRRRCRRSTRLILRYTESRLREPRARHHGLAATLGADQRSADHPPATGTATVSNYNIATQTFDITVTVSDLPPGDVTGFHIHQAPVGVSGWHYQSCTEPGPGPLGHWIYVQCHRADTTGNERSCIPGRCHVRGRPYRNALGRRRSRSVLFQQLCRDGDRRRYWHVVDSGD